MNFLKKSFYSYYYLLIISVAAFLCWNFRLETVGIVLFTVLAIVSLAVTDDMSPAVAPLSFLALSLGDNLSVEGFIRANALWIVPLFLLLLASFVFFFVRNKVRFGIGKMFFPLLLLSLAYCFGGIFHDFPTFLASLPVTLAFLLFFFVVYFIFSNGINAENKRYFCNIFVFMGLLVCAELATCYSGLTYEQILSKDAINLGWGISNNIASLLLLTMPFSAYLSTKSKVWYLYVAAFFIQLVAIVLTLSRGCVLFAFFGTPACLIYAYIVSENRRRYLLFCLLCCAILVAAAAISISVFRPIIERYIHLGFDDSSRFELYLEGWKDFLAAPLFGHGALFKFDSVKNLPYMYHSVPIQFAVNSGAVGLAAYVFYFVVKYRLFLKNGGAVNVFILIAMLMWEGYSLIDCNFFITLQAIIMVIMLVLSEKNVYNYDSKLSVPKA